MSALKVPAGVNANGNGSRARILRIGILLGGKIVEERLIREHVSVSVGQSMKNTFSIPVEGLPLEHTLFVLENDRYFLRFLPKMDGRLSDGGNVTTLEQLKTSGAQQSPGFWQVPLSPTARGKLSLGDLTVLFQFVTEPPRQPRPMLPASVRGTFADRLDPRLMVILGASIVIHFSLAIAALVHDVDTNNGIAERAYNLTFKPDEYTVDVEKPQPQKTADAGSAAATKPAEKPTPKAVEKTEPKPDAGRDTKQDIALQETNARAMADLLTSESNDGTSEGGMSNRRPGNDLGQQIANVRENGKEIAIGGGAGRGLRGDGSARVGTGHGPSLDVGGTEVAGGPKVEKAPTGRIAVADKQGDADVSLTPDVVLSKIKSVYMSQIQRCYTSYLKKDATARGKIALAFTVNETGRSVSSNASGLNPEVDGCVTNLMQTWRFPVPKDKDGDATSATYKITLQLVPD